MRGDSPLHKVKWLRIVLDEGHTIRNPNAQQTKAALNLEGHRRWVLTGKIFDSRGNAMQIILVQHRLVFPTWCFHFGFFWEMVNVCPSDSFGMF